MSPVLFSEFYITSTLSVISCRITSISKFSINPSHFRPLIYVLLAFLAKFLICSFPLFPFNFVSFESYRNFITLFYLKKQSYKLSKHFFIKTCIFVLFDFSNISIKFLTCCISDSPLLVGNNSLYTLPFSL